MMTSGSMGATLAFTSGLIVSILAIAYFKNSLSIILKYLVRIALAALLIGGVLYVAGNQKQEKQNHFERIIVGRFDKSSSGRLDLWSRGVDALLEHNAFFWGVGPENFRVVDAAQNDNQLHNDTLAFLVERGLLGLAGLGLFAVITLLKALQILRLLQKYPERASWGVVVFLAALAATLVESLTHQVFHTRELWLVLAFQEAVLFKMTTSENGINPIAQPARIPAQRNSELVVQPEVMVNG
jgi:O-antigen ligase